MKEKKKNVFVKTCCPQCNEMIIVEKAKLAFVANCKSCGYNLRLSYADLNKM